MFINLSQTNKYLQKANIAFACLFISVFIVLAIIRSQYPFEIEIFEGNSLEQVRRLLAGHKIYVPPTIDFVPNIYTPLYYVFSAILAGMLGANFFTLRLLSILSTLGILFIIYLFVEKETKNKTAGLIAAGLFAATYKLCYTWFDIARVDALYNFFLISSIYILRHSVNNRRLLYATLLFTLAYFSKQSVILFLIPLTLSVYFTDRIKSFKFIFYSLVIITGVHLIMEIFHNGWFFYYIWKLPATNGIDKTLLIPFWTKGIFAPLGIAVFLIGFYFFKAIAKKIEFANSNYYLSIFLGLILLAFAGRANALSNLNAMMPAYMSIAVMLGIAMDGLCKWWNNKYPGSKDLGIFIILLFVFFQFTLLLYPFHKQLPAAADKATGHFFLSAIRNIEGRVWIPAHGYLSAMVNKKAFANQFSMYEVLREFEREPDQAGQNFLNSMQAAINSRLFDAIILDWPFIFLKVDTSLSHKLTSILNANYNYTGRILTDSHGFYPLLNSIRPTYLFVSKNKTPEYSDKLLRRFSRLQQIKNDNGSDYSKANYQKRILAAANDMSTYAALINKGIESAVQGNFDQAAQHWRQAKALDINRPEAYANLAVLMERSGNRKAALRSYQFAAQKLGMPWNQYYERLRSLLEE